MIAKAMLGLLPLTAVTNGSIDMGGTEIIGASERALADLRGRYVGAVFQNPAASLNPVMTVAQQIALPLRLHYDLTKAERADRVNALLSKVGLDLDMAGKYPHELSGGQQQRVGIATALITSPRFIIADEPTTALDSITKRQIVDLLTSLVDDAGASMLFITHELPLLYNVTDDIMVMYAGQIVEKGTAEEMVFDPVHPYSHGLMSSILVPEEGTRGHKLTAIPGTPPNLKKPPQGCRFAERCKYARPECRYSAIPEKDLGDGRMYRCLLGQDELKEVYSHE